MCIQFPPAQYKPQQPAAPLLAEVFHDDVATACGITVRSSSPVLLLCRQLLAQGVDPSTPLALYRDDTLCLKVRSIGEAAGIEVAAHGVGFVKHHARASRAASLVRLPPGSDADDGGAR